MSHDAVVEVWPECLPLAVVPLWQELQVPGATMLWLIVAGVQPDVRWQVSHEAVVVVCPEFLPLAMVPLWQELQVPGATPLWFIVAGVQPPVRWHVSQLAVDGIWFVGLTDAPIRLPEAWQALQSRGVPLNTPLIWQDSQRTLACAPESGKPVVM